MKSEPVPPPFRTGIGHDIHRVQPGGRLVLGGVPIPCEFGLAGHSDADVVLHALCDALLGAVGKGDIGEHFPNSDPAYRGADSARFVDAVIEIVRSAGYRASNVDLMVLAESPPLREFKPRMRTRIAELLNLPVDRVGIKAGTNEGVDAVGRGEAIACLATALVVRLDSQTSC